MQIDQDRLRQLPADGSIYNDLRSVEVDSSILQLESDLPTEVSNQNDTTVGAIIEESVVPDLTVDETEQEAIQNAFRQDDRRSYFLMGSISSQPLSEWDPSVYILRLAFPTLYLTGQASLNVSRQRQVSLPD